MIISTVKIAMVSVHKLAAAQEGGGGGGGDGDDNARRRRRDKLKDMLLNMELQLKPLTEQLNRVKDMHVPEFETLQAWEARARAATGRLNGGEFGAHNIIDSSSGFGDHTKVEVAFSGGVHNDADQGEDTKSGNVKVFPPCMFKQGMNLTEGQRGEVKQDSEPADVKDDKKRTVGGDNLQSSGADLHVWYASIIRKREEDLLNAQIQNGVSGTSSDRQVGMKSKRDREDDGDDDDDDDVGWEEAPTAGIHKSESYKVNDLSVQAEDALGDDDDDDLDWEEG